MAVTSAAIEAALAPERAAEPHGLVALRTGVIDRAHNTTRFFVLAPGRQQIPDGADKTTVSFVTSHHPGALALALTHPTSPTAWMEKWVLLKRLQTRLETDLGPEKYEAVWERGTKLEFETVLGDFSPLQGQP